MQKDKKAQFHPKPVQYLFSLLPLPCLQITKTRQFTYLHFSARPGFDLTSAFSIVQNMGRLKVRFSAAHLCDLTGNN